MLYAELSINNQKIGSVTVWNDGSGNNALGNYEYWFRCLDKKVEHRGHVRKFPRIEGAWRLLEKVIICVHEDLGTKTLEEPDI